MRTLILFCLILLSPLSFGRSASKGCKWVPFESTSLGLKLQVEDCPGSNHYEFSTSGNNIERHRPSDDTIFGSHQIIEVFTKSASQPIEEAIRKQFIEKLEPKARKGCKVVPVSDKVLPKGR